ncbi:transposase [Enterococcus cecorum]|uniref:IS66 family insertion sequence element accessory protein TnpB n=1 Tax=Enterococcus cecorum TaxID=44008 RepID=UPI0006415389|nr:IS66 family insertion sequence element accessory protein TnpB [Enterococcus cecorum]KLN93879.1 transposase [Enterococcus cecorum]KLN94693.1 transposase [Enterococcus cecorum]
MLVDFTRVKNIFIVCGRTDMRKGIDGLASIVQYEYNIDLYDDAIFLFFSGKSDRFKALYWDGDGFILLYKRINDGKLKWPQKSEEIMKLSNQQLRRLLEGLSIIQPNAVKKGVKKTF